ncbi:MAG TPA: hypothetical protein DCL15_21045 [Chloroflexi bacterium]|nr:hypothetical protein [Chloroflexota bacterium]HHW89120.1 DUF2723 domain-containing protein [Chloroflexota bacterium]
MARWSAVAVAGLLAFALYFASLAPGLTWAHQGADGGELLAAAITGGVPHPPGYPLYTTLLQGWLTLIGWWAPASDLAWRGNLLSAISGAASVCLTVLVAGELLPRGEASRWLWALAAGLAWAFSPLLWSQSILTEVYSFHALLVVLLAWVVLVKPLRLWYVVLPVALGVAHHLTLILLLPAAFYALVTARTGVRRWQAPLVAMIGGVCLGALCYVRIPLAASNGPPPVNWGYADNWDGFQWLVSGAAYRGYLFSGGLSTTLQRLTTWTYTLTTQFSPMGLALGFVGLATWDRNAARLRNFSLLWVTPVSVYAILYYTRDSEIYLLPVVWLVCIWMAVGLATLAVWLTPRFAGATPVLAGITGLALLLLAATNWPTLALHNDDTARQYLVALAQTLEPDSLLVTLEDRETFAAWYGAWGDRTLTAAAPGLIPVNESLYQFAWYQRLQRDLYPDVPAIDTSAAALVAANAGLRPIYFAEPPAWIDAVELEQVGPLWRLKR